MPGFFTGTWFGVFGPAGMPAGAGRPRSTPPCQEGTGIAQRTRQFFATSGFVRIDGTTEEFKKLIATDTKHWGDLIKSVGVKLD